VLDLVLSLSHSYCVHSHLQITPQRFNWTQVWAIIKLLLVKPCFCSRCGDPAWMAGSCRNRGTRPLQPAATSEGLSTLTVSLWMEEECRLPTEMRELGCETTCI
ncbi:hypothetical protein DPEC_G00135610, partial [Dallia pectoralis]